MKRLTKRERDGLLKNAGLLHSVPGTDVLKLQAGLGLPWLKLRWLRRYVHKYIMGTCIYTLRICKRLT